MALARCAHGAPARAPALERVTGLAGVYDLYLFDEDGERAVTGRLELWEDGSSSAPVDPLAGPPPVLVGAAEVDGTTLGIVMPGDPSSRAADAPGVGVYWFADDLARVRLGSEANRRDRTRFDGAHATLSVLSIAEDRFGGSWASMEGVEGASGVVDGGDANTRARPAHFAVAVDADVKRRQAGCNAHKFGGFLIDGDVAFRHSRRICDAHAAEQGVGRAVPTGDTMIQVREDGEVLTVGCQGFEQLLAPRPGR